MAEIYPLQILIASLAGWMNRRQSEVLEYLIEENRVLKEQLKGRALRLTDDQRRRLAAKGKRIGRRLLMQVATIVTPDTILKWHRQLIRAKWTFEAKRVGRPGLMKEIRELIVRFAKENCGWGYCRIEGALRNVGHRVSPSRGSTPRVRLTYHRCPVSTATAALPWIAAVYLAIVTALTSSILLQA